MSNNLKEFLKSLGSDPEKLKRFKEDPHSVMDEHDLSEEHKQLVLDGNRDKLKEEAGADDSEANLFIV